MTDFATLDAFRQTLSALPCFDAATAGLARRRQANLTKPAGSLGRLEEIAEFVAGWRGTAIPSLTAPQIIIFAGNHGICDQGVNPFPQAVTAQMVANFRNGGASINQFASLSGAALTVVPIELDRPTQDFSLSEAMTEADLLEAINIGAKSVSETADFLVLGEMGIGNSTTAAAVSCALFGGEPSDWVGPGTGANAEGIARKARVISEALTLHAAKMSDPLAALRCFGGREFAAIVGAIIAARLRRIPVLLDGFICCAAAAPLLRFAGALDHCLVGHQSAEPGHQRLLTALGKNGILSLGMRLGEGSGAAVALLIVKAALAMHSGMATFEEAKVSAS